jgi:phenylalanyl-tRNA synthetase beta chain
LLQVLKFNQARKAPRVRIFEVGRVFLRDGSVHNSDTTVQGVNQPMRISGLACGSVDSLQWGRKEQSVDFYDVKGEIETLLAPFKAEFQTSSHPSMHPGRCAQVVLNGKAIGYVGELHPEWRQAYEISQTPILFELDLDAVLDRPVPSFKAVAKFQAVQRDIAVVVEDHISHSALMKAIWEAPSLGVLQEAQLFDVYRPKTAGKEPLEAGMADRSLAVRLTLNLSDATLTETQIESTVKAVIDHLGKTLGARQRV